jgi:O-antigen ligase
MGKDTDESVMIRSNMIKFGVEAIKEKPFVGYGLGAYNFISGYNSYAHNNYIEIGVSLGLIGLLIYYSMHVCIFLIGLKRVFIKKTDNNYYFFSFTMIIIVLILDLGLVDFSDEFFHFLIILSFSGLLHRNWT